MLLFVIIPLIFMMIVIGEREIMGVLEEVLGRPKEGFENIVIMIGLGLGIIYLVGVGLLLFRSSMGVLGGWEESSYYFMSFETREKGVSFPKETVIVKGKGYKKAFITIFPEGIRFEKKQGFAKEKFPPLNISWEEIDRIERRNQGGRDWAWITFSPGKWRKPIGINPKILKTHAFIPEKFQIYS